MTRQRSHTISLAWALTLSWMGTAPANEQIPRYVRPCPDHLEVKAHLLTFPGVQDDLNLTADQVNAIASANEAYSEAIAKVFRRWDEKTSYYSRSIDLLSATSTGGIEQRLALKKILAELNSKQSERLPQIEFQFALKMNDPNIWANEYVQGALHFSSAQRYLVKVTLTDLQKDIRERRPVVGYNGIQTMPSFPRGTRTTDELRKQANETITGMFDANQKQLVKTLGGRPCQFEEPFKLFDSGIKSPSRGD